MKLLLALPLALSILASSGTAAAATPSLVCAFGIPGFVTDDPDLLVMFVGIQLPFVNGTSKLGTTAAGEIDRPVQFSIASQIPTGEERYKFTATSGDTKLQVTVSTRQFKGRFAGVKESDLKEAMAASAAVSLSSDPQTALPVVNGFCLNLR